jgi:predicted transport protein
MRFDLTGEHTEVSTMPLFAISKKNSVESVEKTNFDSERDLQRLVEGNLEPLFRCRFVATEFQTGIQHGGRIDTLALSEDNNPVIIEYKKIASSELVTQSLYYLAWIHDHKGDFEVAARKTLGSKVTVDWDEVRVICLAPSYKKFDIHAVQVMGTSIELWTYGLFSNQTLFLEEVQQKELVSVDSSGPASAKNPVMVAAGKKAAMSRKTGVYTFAQHWEDKPEIIQELAHAVHEYVLGLDLPIEAMPKKLYVAYRTTENFVCMDVRKKNVYLFLKLDPKKVPVEPGFLRDVSKIGHYGTGNLEVTLTSMQDFERAKPLIQQAYKAIGG